MARKSIYVKAEDEALFDELAGSGNLSSIIIEALKAHTGHDIPQGMQEIELWRGLKKIRFVGKEIWPPTDNDCCDPEIESRRYLFESHGDQGPECVRVRIFYTKKGKLLKYWFDEIVDDEFYVVYDSLEDLARQHDLCPNNLIYHWLAARSGHPIIEDLDL